MANTKEDAIKTALTDLANRLGIEQGQIVEESVQDAEFPDMALGAAAKDEMSGQMITPGWRIRLKAKGQAFEYRANRNQVRLYQYKGQNYKV
jgi:hypothetical protein